jgi:hypothetical protein
MTERDRDRVRERVREREREKKREYMGEKNDHFVCCELINASSR